MYPTRSAVVRGVRGALLLAAVCGGSALVTHRALGEAPAKLRKIAAAHVMRASASDARYMCKNDCGFIGDSDLRAMCKGDCGFIGDSDLRYLCKGDCGFISRSDLRYLCKGDCGFISDSELRAVCKGDCGFISSSNLRYLCKGDCGFISQAPGGSPPRYACASQLQGAAGPAGEALESRAP